MTDVTSLIEARIHQEGFHDGFCHLFCPHTTAGLTINEGADPAVAHDILGVLNDLAPASPRYTHAEGNSDAHMKSTLVGVSLSIPVDAGRLALGRWQRVFFCEFDGPRQREIWLRFTEHPN